MKVFKVVFYILLGIATLALVYLTHVLFVLIDRVTGL